MKKLCALLLVAVMCLGLLPFAVSADEPTSITIGPKFGAWENWINSPNNPAGAGEQPGVTQLLVGITDQDGNKIDIDAALTWKLTITAGEESKTITMSPATKALDYNLYRFETCFGEGENKFVPVAGTDYTVQINVYDGETLKYQSAAVSGFTVPAGLVPVTSTDVPEPPTYEFPYEFEVTPHFGEVENWSGGTFFISGYELPAGVGEPEGTIANKVKDGTYKLKVVVTDETTAKDYTIPEYFFDTPSKEFYIDGNFAFFRIAACEYGIPMDGTHTYSIAYEITEGGELRYSGVSAEGAFDAFNEAFTTDGPIVPEEVPHSCLVSDKGVEPTPEPDPEPTPDPEPEPEPVVKQDVTIAPLFGAWENWTGSPNAVGGAGVTQLLVGITDKDGNQIDIDAALTWKITISDGTTTKTITMSPATKALTYNLYRFETCLGKGENQFVPVAGTDYTVQISVYSGEDLAYESAAVSGFTVPAELVPAVPVEPEWPDNLVLAPLFGCVENWSDNTFFIVGNSGSQFESNADIHAKLKDGTYAMKVIITDETDGKVYTIAKYMFDNEGTGKKEFYADASFLRIAVCDYGIVPVKGHEYTVAYEITEGGELRYNATSEIGAFNQFNPAFTADGAIVPEEVPHTCEVADKATDPEPTPTPTPEPTPSEEPTPTPTPSQGGEPTPTPTPEPTPEESKPATSKPAGGDDNKDDGGNTGLIVGIVIAVVAVAAIAVVVVFVVKKKKD
jgi:hypothetical protein